MLRHGIYVIVQAGVRISCTGCADDDGGTVVVSTWWLVVRTVTQNLDIGLRRLDKGHVDAGRDELCGRNGCGVPGLGVIRWLNTVASWMN